MAVSSPSWFIFSLLVTEDCVTWKKLMLWALGQFCAGWEDSILGVNPQYKSLNRLLLCWGLAGRRVGLHQQVPGGCPLCCTGFIVYSIKSSEVARCVGVFLWEVLWMGGMSCFGSRDELLSEFTRAKKFLGTEAAADCTASVCVTFFPWWKGFFVKLEILYLPSGTWKVWYITNLVYSRCESFQDFP